MRNSYRSFHHQKLFPVLSFFTLCVLLLCNCNQVQTPSPGDGAKTVKDLSTQYIDAWKSFYPSAALAAGDKTAAFTFDTLSIEKIDRWIAFNRDVRNSIQKISKSNLELSFDDASDARILDKQAATEIEKWEVDPVYQNSPGFYSGSISQALTYVLVRKNLSPQEKIEAISKRLVGICQLCAFAKKHLSAGRPAETASSIEGLEASASFFAGKLPAIAASWLPKTKGDSEAFSNLCNKTAAAIRSLASYIQAQIVPANKLPNALGASVYARKFKLYTGLAMTPGQLEEISLREIHEVRTAMVELASAYWRETYSTRQMPDDLGAVLQMALEDMEKDREDNQKDFLKLFIDLTAKAERFVREKHLAPLPQQRTLFIALSPPHFAGAAVGGVYPSGPFDPGADTLFYLPSIPDDAPGEAKEGFYRSFNNHFNTMIIPHEMFPGHYLHLKLAASNPRLLRSLFCSDLYAEGWATLCEQVVLAEGWDNDSHLTHLAHLRKRLENAVRAYVSVQVHTKNWTKEQMTHFAVETGLLPRQFAVNLWHRVMGSPFQLTSYFLGYRAFQALYLQEKKKAGQQENFKFYEFSQKILEAASVPIDMLPHLLSPPGKF